MPPFPRPIGLELARTAHLATEAFERVMAEAGSSVSAWQVLVLIRSQRWDNQTQMAQAMGITGATLTHHLAALESQGLVHRWREPGNRRVQRVELTDEGVALFDRLRAVAVRHDRRLRSGLTDDEVDHLRVLLGKLRTGVDGADDSGAQMSTASKPKGARSSST